MNREKYWRCTGYKFEGAEEEFIKTCPRCLNNFLPRADEEGYFLDWYCTIDFKLCDNNCKNHQKPRKLNPDIAEFFYATCERYKR